MKNNKILVGILGVTLSITSCKKDLDISPIPINPRHRAHKLRTVLFRWRRALFTGMVFMM
jgi:hypothetical protein